jgi:hypothetical protein
VFSTARFRIVAVLKPHGIDMGVQSSHSVFSSAGAPEGIRHGDFSLKWSAFGLPTILDPGGLKGCIGTTISRPHFCYSRKSMVTLEPAVTVP